MRAFWVVRGGEACREDLGGDDRLSGFGGGTYALSCLRRGGLVVLDNLLDGLGRRRGSGSGDMARRDLVELAGSSVPTYS